MTWQSRVLEEFAALETRRAALVDFLELADIGYAEDPPSGEDLELLHLQLQTMNAYSMVLSMRIARFQKVNP